VFLGSNLSSRITYPYWGSSDTSGLYLKQHNPYCHMISTSLFSPSMDAI
jgi:hypothetical protein